MSIARTIARLSKVTATLEPPFDPGFCPPAELEVIRSTESELGVTFPAELIEFLLAANGQTEPGMNPNPVLPCLRFRSGSDIMCTSSATWLNGVSDIVDITQCLRSEYDELEICRDEFVVHGPAKYHRNVIGITTTENSDSLVLDLEPTSGGVVGQVVMVRTQPFEIAVIAPCFASLLEYVLDGYQTGRFLYDPKWSSWIEVDAAA